MHIAYWGRQHPGAVEFALQKNLEQRLFFALEHYPSVGEAVKQFEDFLVVYEPEEAISYRSESDFNSVHPDTEEDFWNYVDSASGRRVKMDRGGGLVWHGPGQVCLDPVVNLKKRRINFVDEYVSMLEDACINVLRTLGINAQKNRYCEDARGVWVSGKKLAFLGAKLDPRAATVVHGIAVNVSPDLYPFSLIDPCNLPGVQVTSVFDVLGWAPPIHEFGKMLAEAFRDLILAATKK